MTGSKLSNSSLQETTYLAVGILRRPHGLRGDLLLTIYTDFPERLVAGTQLFIGEEHTPLKIIRRRLHNDGLILGFDGVNTPEDAARFRSKMAFVPSVGRPPLPEGEYYHHEIIGLRVLEENGRDLGVIKEILETGANDVYLSILPDGRELLIPALKQVLLDINLAEGHMRVHLLPGLLTDSEEA